MVNLIQYERGKRIEEICYENNNGKSSKTSFEMKRTKTGRVQKIEIKGPRTLKEREDIIIICFIGLLTCQIIIDALAFYNSSILEHHLYGVHHDGFNDLEPAEKTRVYFKVLLHILMGIAMLGSFPYLQILLKRLH